MAQFVLRLGQVHGSLFQRVCGRYGTQVIFRFGIPSFRGLYRVSRSSRSIAVLMAGIFWLAPCAFQ